MNELQQMAQLRNLPNVPLRSITSLAKGLEPTPSLFRTRHL